VHYPKGFTACISDGSMKYNRSNGELWYLPGRTGRHCVDITALNVIGQNSGSQDDFEDKSGDRRERRDPPLSQKLIIPWM
jgi:hypothetical protein